VLRKTIIWKREKRRAACV